MARGSDWSVARELAPLGRSLQKPLLDFTLLNLTPPWWGLELRRLGALTQLRLLWIRTWEGHKGMELMSRAKMDSDDEGCSDPETAALRAQGRHKRAAADDDLLALAAQLPHLVSLRLHIHGRFSAAALIRVASYCRQLQYLFLPAPLDYRVLNQEEAPVFPELVWLAGISTCLRDPYSELVLTPKYANMKHFGLGCRLFPVASNNLLSAIPSTA